MKILNNEVTKDAARNVSFVMMTHLQVLSIILVNNSQENADKYIHADNDENNEEYAVPVVQVVCRNPERLEKKMRTYLHIGKGRYF